MVKKTPTAEQAAIIEAPHDDTFLVVAGAGSGKTYTMTERIIHLIDQGVPPQHILGLTFTRKAASELLQRVTSAYTKSLHADDTSNAARFMKPEVLTYDAFFQGIVRRYGLLVGFDQNVQPLSEAGAHQLISDVVDANMQQVLEASKDYGSFSTMVNDVYALSNNIASSMIGGDCHTFDQAVQRVHEWDQAFLDLLDELIGERELPEKIPNFKSVPKRTKKQTDQQYAEKVAQINAENELIGEQKALQTAMDLREVTRKRETLLSLVQLYAQAKQQRHMAEFGDFTIAAYQLVTQFPSIGEQYRRRYTHVLLDEYQDTSTTQASLLAALFHPDSTPTHADEAGMQPAGTSAVGAVGDPFQSIYAWRGASPGAFRMFQRDFGLPPTYAPLPITMTRRNAKLVLEAANALTMSLRKAPKRRSSSPMREVDVPELTTMATADRGVIGMQHYVTRGEEIDGIVRFVHEAQRKYGSVDPEMGVDAQAPHVALLFRSKTHMDEYRAALESAGLSVQVVGKSALLDRAEVRDVLALLHAASDHADAAHMLRLLATARYHVNAHDLAAFAKLAEQLNMQQRYRLLCETGVVKPSGKGDDLDAAIAATALRDQKAAVREYRNKLPNSVFLVDTLLHDDLAQLLTTTDISEQGRASLLSAAQALQAVKASLYGPLDEAIRAASEALNLDIDMLVAAGLQGRDEHAASVQSPLRSLHNLVSTYVQEISNDQSVSLRGFLAWVESLKDAQEETAQGVDAVCDVVLMTIHQSKGLEWDAVVIPSLEANTFPSNVGEHLKIETPDTLFGQTHAPGSGAVEDAPMWQPPEYQETADTWLTMPQAVPVPVRVDAGILPQFPHDAADGSSDDEETGAVDPLAALRRLDALETLDDELKGSLRQSRSAMAQAQGDADDANNWYLTQLEEYGRRHHADERRLMYVAITRAKKAVLLTASTLPTALTRDETLLSGDERGKSVSNFFAEVEDVLTYHHANQQDWASTPTNLHETATAEDAAGGQTLRTPQGLGFDLPQGFFVGDDAQTWENVVVGDAWNAPLTDDDTAGTLPFPTQLSPALAQRLAHSAQLVREAMATLHDADTQGGDGVAAAGMAQPQESKEATQPTLQAQAQKILHDVDLSAAAVLRGAQLNKEILRKAQAVLRTKRLTVTTLQHYAGHDNEAERLEFARSLVRPIPYVSSSSAAQAGTRLHNWAERFLKAGSGETLESQAAMINDMHEAMRNLDMREQQLEADSLEDHKDTAKALQAERDMLTWQQRIVESPWAARQLEAAEQSVVMAVPKSAGESETDGAANELAIMPGKIDAIFRGRLDGSDTEHSFTIVDWKTGRRPVKPEDVQEKLRQLDFYRLLWSRAQDIPIERIDATLYYVSEADENRRSLTAEPKSEQQILNELREGIPQGVDGDDE
ncbi:ATP-dependent DNA helicase [Bifidobacterium gallicum]|uniref:DNA 3'-5' helicase n=1 Tax=Bifidobacterium gallicum DSM 20093 = LMG 11596 TaxID=561180 RepID=D1NTB5_9BIFI|nr:ATP-dependent DNA helicase [Bifidobacterium gallicum]EFA22969.1 UvrD/REP helicase [Bifidobacterium gallicum DSM 20093 = LMG 11596]KFI57708.1 UvrD/REP helicase family protein [Bifidobacterium gallicum DSM 20093 = LMG 11596]